MKTFQLFVALIATLLFTSVNAFSQCTDEPIVDVTNVSDITVTFGATGSCPNTSSEVDVSFSGEITAGDVSSPDPSNTDCDIVNVDITFADDFLGGCPEEIIRTWMVDVEYSDGNEIFTYDQTITLEDDVAPTIDSPAPPVDVMIIDACDETDSNVEADTGFAFSGSAIEVDAGDYPGDYTEDCIVSINGNQDMVTYMDVYNPIGCPSDVGIIERTWTITDECGNSATDVQIITLMDAELPKIIDCPADVTLSLTNACDETDANIEVVTGFPWMGSETPITQAEFESIGGSTEELCDMDLVAYYVDETPTFFEDNCPNEFLSFVRTWTLEDDCGNISDECQQTILIFDMELPTISDCPGGGSVLEIPVANGDPCDDTNPDIQSQSGFPFSAAPTSIDIPEFPGSAFDNCNGGDVASIEYMDQNVQTGCDAGNPFSFYFERVWTVTDLCGNMSTCSQEITLTDEEDPIFPTFPNFFYDQGPQGPDAGVWEIESIFCNAEVDFTTEFTLPGPGEIMDNCAAFGDLNIVYTPDISAGPLAIAEGDNIITVVINDQCGNRFMEEWVITMVCVGCGPDQIFEACTDPPTICDIEEVEGFTSCTPEFTTGFGALCSGFSLDNPSYFEFIAGAEELDFEVMASNCSDGQGIQATITDPCDATTCYTDLDGNLINQGQTQTVSASGLTVGNIYQLVVDGWGGDECNWQIISVSAQAFAIPDPEPEEQIAEVTAFPGCDADDLIFCQGSSVTFWPDTFEEAMYFFCWNVDNMNGVSSSNGFDDCTEFTALETLGQTYECDADFSSCGPLELTFDEVGTYTLCLTELENGCDTETPTDYCWEVTIVPNGVIDFGIVEVCEHDLVGGWFPDIDGPNGESWQGPTIFGDGVTNDFVQDDCGCDFEYMIEVIMLEEEEEEIDVLVCAEDLVNYFNQGLGVGWSVIEDFYNDFDQTAYLNPLEEASDQIAYDGIACDTFVFINFFLFDVPGQIVQTPGPTCDVILELELDLNLFPDDLIDPDDLFYFWSGENGALGTQATQSVTEPGDYELAVEIDLDDGSMCSFIFEVNVVDFGTMPAPPTFQASPNETCITELTGIVYSVPPAPGATFNWEVANGSFVENATGDEITITILDPTLVTEVCVSANSACGPSDPACETITVTPAPIVELMPVADVCVNQTINIASLVTAGSADEFFWNIPGGSFTQAGASLADNLDVSWATAGTYMVELSVEDPSGCQSNVTSIEVVVLDPLDPPTALCTMNTSNSVEITITEGANAPNGFTFNITTGQTATEDNGVITVTGLVLGEVVNIELLTLGGTHPCGDQAGIDVECIPSECPLNPALQMPGEICLDGTEAPFQLVETAGNPGGMWDGPGTDAITGMFDPAAAGPGVHTIIYTVVDNVADCMESAQTTIVVFPSPIEDFAPSIDTVCIDEVLTISFEDSVDKTYTWDFDADNSNPAVDDTDFQLSYSSPGEKTITMTISTGPGCESTVTKDVFVREALVFPEIFCTGLSPVSVGFEWDPIDGVEEYEYEISINGDVITGTTDVTEIPVDGLEEGDIVDLNITGVDVNGCLNPIQIGQCIAQDCPDIVVELQSSEDLVLCFDPLNPPVIQLTQTSTIDGNDAVGTGEWVGSDQLDMVTGEFTPDGPGEYVLSYVFSEEGTACPGNESITFNILESPGSEFTQDFEEICIEDVITFTLEDDYDSAILYDWSSTYDPNGYELIDNADGTFTVQFFEAGSGDFSLQTSVAGCESPITTLSVEVGEVPELPVITCEEDLGYILFEWNAVDCVEEYIVFIDGEEQDPQTNTDFELTGLDPNQNVEIEIQIVSNCLCDFPSTISANCTAQDCEEATITFDGSVPTEYCSSSLPTFTFTADVDGPEIDNSGVFTWSGDGVDADGNVDFTGFSAGTYTIDVEYEEDDCFYSNSITFEVLENPGIVVTTFNAPCPGALGEVMINGEGNGPFSFQAEGNALNSGMNELTAGDYDVVVTDVNGCETEASFTIGTDQEPNDDLLVPQSTILAGTDAVLTYTTEQENIENVVWTVNGEIVADIDCATEDCFNVNYTPAEEGSYEVCTFASYDGTNCELVECREFNANELTFSAYYIPNIITPENEEDPINTTLSIFVEGDPVTIHSVGIYDRWGNRVHFNDEEFTVNGDEVGVLWDGRFEDNKNFIAGVYVYIIETEIDGVREWDTDDITIIN